VEGRRECPPREMIFYIECEMPPKKKIILPIWARVGAYLRRPERKCEKVFRSSEDLEPIRKLLESNESDVIPCQALDSAGERPMWKPEHRRAADRTGLRYPSDLSDAEWLIVEPMIPPAKRGGRRRSVNVREVLNGIFYVLWTGCQWKALPKDLPPKSTVHDYLELWNWDGTLERIHHELYMAVREQEGREPSPTVAIIDSQTAKGSQKGGLGSILRATTRARRSRVASGTSWSTRWASC
jgi:transposase